VVSVKKNFNCARPELLEGYLRALDENSSPGSG